MHRARLATVPSEATARLARVRTGPMPELLVALDAFLQEHRRCGELNASVEKCFVWMACECGAELVRVLDEPSKDT